MDQAPFLAPHIPGFQPDVNQPFTGWIVTPEGTRRVFVKHPRNPDRMREEVAALRLVQQNATMRIAPTFYGFLENTPDVQMALSYEDGVNLVDILTPGATAPPMPAWYPAQSTDRQAITQAQLLLLMDEISQAVKALHQIKLDLFGKLVSPDPNPYRTAAQDYTWQEVNFRLQFAEQKGHLAAPLLEEARSWGKARIDLLDNSEIPCLIHYDLHSGNIRVFYQDGHWHFRVLYDFELARGWLPDYDLAGLRWYIEDYLGDTMGEMAWKRFLAGYGQPHNERLRFFEFTRCLSAVAYSERYPQWGNWCLAKMISLLEG